MRVLGSKTQTAPRRQRQTRPVDGTAIGVVVVWGGLRRREKSEPGTSHARERERERELRERKENKVPCLCRSWWFFVRSIALKEATLGRKVQLLPNLQGAPGMLPSSWLNQPYTYRSSCHTLIKPLASHPCSSSISMDPTHVSIYPSIRALIDRSSCWGVHLLNPPPSPLVS